ncbi:MAG: peptidase S41, partial [Candidatus Eisenbacteria bacterium]|nr:peptidase S41 [Candidatus Eisenbacteria bacterium]
MFYRFWKTALAFLALGVLLSNPAFAIDTEDTRMLHNPAVSENHIAFSYSGDLWVADRDGGNPRRLTSHIGDEVLARFSPDGKTIAFTAEYDGNLDIFTVAVTGGVPKRLTWHPGPDLVRDFAPDGKSVLFVSARNTHTNRFLQLYSVSLEGGMPTQLPVPSAWKASYSPDGSKIAYTPLQEPFAQWKHYRGGRISRVWVYDVKTQDVVEVPKPEGGCNDTDPMWVGDRVYFTSDRAGEFNLFSFDPSTNQVTQQTFDADFPMRGASTDGKTIVYEKAGYLHIFNALNPAAKRLQIGISADLVETRPRYMSGDQYIQAASLSPSGSRAVFEFRGEIVSVPKKKGDVRVLTHTPGVHERSPE